MSNDEEMLTVTESAGLFRLPDLAGYLVHSLDGAAAVDALRQGALLEALAGKALVLAVRQARSEGRTWEQIGGVLGVSRSAAHQRFSAKM